MNITTNNVQAAKTNKTQDNREWIDSKVTRYLAWQEQMKVKTFAEYWNVAPLNVTEGVSVGNYRMLTIGNPNGVNNIAVYSIPALNALSDLPKYDKPKWHFHEALFDPRKDERDVRVVYDVTTAHFAFFNWKNGAFSPSLLNNPNRIAKLYQDKNPKIYSNLMNKLMRMVRKHLELDRLLNCLENGYCYTIILRTDADVAHYENNIKKYFEAPYSEYHAAQIARWSAADAADDIANPVPTQPAFIETVKGDRAEILAELSAALEPVDVEYTTLSSTIPVVRTFNPEEPEKSSAPNISLKAIANAPGAFKFSIRTPGKATPETKGKSKK
jgi:hypothetical protein